MCSACHLSLSFGELHTRAVHLLHTFGECAQESKQKGPKDEAEGLAKRLQRINEALDEANRKAQNSRSAASDAKKEADGLRPKYTSLKVRV